MKRLGQTAIALVAAASACAGGVLALSTVTGGLPMQLGTSPVSTVQSNAGAAGKAEGVNASTPIAQASTPMTVQPAAYRAKAAPATHASSGASGAAGGHSSSQEGDEREED